MFIFPKFKNLKFKKLKSKKSSVCLFVDGVSLCMCWFVRLCLLRECLYECVDCLFSMSSGRFVRMTLVAYITSLYRHLDCTGTESGNLQ
jgi:hypothetical protein